MLLLLLWPGDRDAFFPSGAAALMAAGAVDGTSTLPAAADAEGDEEGNLAAAEEMCRGEEKSSFFTAAAAAAVVVVVAGACPRLVPRFAPPPLWEERPERPVFESLWSDVEDSAF